MTDRLELVLRRSLLSMATQTRAWILTGGTDAGVMRLVGRFMTADPASADFPCIGICTLGVIHDHEVCSALASGSERDLPFACAPSAFRVAPRGHSSARRDMDMSMGTGIGMEGDGIGHGLWHGGARA